MDNYNEEDESTLSTEVAQVAKQIYDESTNRKLPASLLQLKKLIDSVAPGSDALYSIIHDVWQLKLVDVLAVVLKMDFTAVPPNEWSTAAQLVNLAVACFVNERGKSEYVKDAHAAELLQMVSESILECARNCQTRYCGLAAERVVPSNGTEKIYCHRALKEIFAELLRLVEAYPGLSSSVIRSANLSNILLNEMEEVSQLAISFIGNLYTPPISAPADFDAHEIVEELLFKLATSNNIPCCRECVTAITQIIEYNSRYANLINLKFKGVKEMILENWVNRLMLREQEIKDFYHLIDARDPSKQLRRSMNTQVAAIMLIQAYVRSYQARKKLKAANAAFSRFHMKWREKKKRQQDEKAQQQQAETARFQLLLAKKQRVRRSRQMLLKQMLATPPEHFPSFLRKLEQSAASRIQAAWRGHQARKRYQTLNEDERRHRAASKIQTSFRSYRVKSSKIVDEMPSRKNAFEMPELTAERRTELERDIQSRVLDFKTRHPHISWSHERLSHLHERGQNALANYFKNLPISRKNLYECSSAMARIEVDLATMRDTCPTLAVSTLEDAARLASGSKPIRSRALAQHRQTVNLLTGPWWGGFEAEIAAEEEEYKRLIGDLPLLKLTAEKDVPDHHHHHHQAQTNEV